MDFRHITLVASLRETFSNDNDHVKRECLDAIGIDAWAQFYHDNSYAHASLVSSLSNNAIHRLIEREPNRQSLIVRDFVALLNASEKKPRGIPMRILRRVSLAVLMATLNRSVGTTTPNHSIPSTLSLRINSSNCTSTWSAATTMVSLVGSTSRNHTPTMRIANVFSAEDTPASTFTNSTKKKKNSTVLRLKI